MTLTLRRLARFADRREYPEALCRRRGYGDFNLVAFAVAEVKRRHRWLFAALVFLLGALFSLGLYVVIGTRLLLQPGGGYNIDVWAYCAGIMSAILMLASVVFYFCPGSQTYRNKVAITERFARKVGDLCEWLGVSVNNLPRELGELKEVANDLLIAEAGVYVSHSVLSKAVSGNRPKSLEESRTLLAHARLTYMLGLCHDLMLVEDKGPDRFIGAARAILAESRQLTEVPAPAGRADSAS